MKASHHATKHYTKAQCLVCLFLQYNQRGSSIGRFSDMKLSRNNQPFFYMFANPLEPNLEIWQLKTSLGWVFDFVNNRLFQFLI
jgi:hypothetical protein